MKGQPISNQKILSHLVALLIGFVLGRNSISFSTEFSRPLEEVNRIAKVFNHDAMQQSSQASANDAQTTEERLATSSSTLGRNQPDDEPQSTDVSTMQNPQAIKAVDCATLDRVEPVNIGLMNTIPSTDGNAVQYVISFAWWERRIHKENFKQGRAVRANPSVVKIQELLSGAPGAFVDVGANVGFMANFAYNQHRQVFAIDPISYNIAKLCEGLNANIERGWTNSSYLHLYHAAAGPSFQANVTIVRPSDRAGYFDQSSLSREAVLKNEVTEEHIPMITVDSIVPEDVPVAVVKIDVQGHEFGVLKGMVGLLGRPKNHPIHVFFEDNEDLTTKAGYTPGACAELLESFGYNCAKAGGDTLCTKK